LFDEFEVRHDTLLGELNLKTAPLQRRGQGRKLWRAPGGQPFSRRLIHEVSVSRQNVHLAEDDRDERGLIFPGQQRQQFMPDAVAANVHLRVGGVSAEGNFFTLGPTRQRSLRFGEQRARERDARIGRRRIAPFHARKTFGSRTAKQAQEKKFNLIVRMMCQRDDADFSFRRSLRKKSVTQFARGHLDGSSICRCVSVNVGPAGDKWQAELFGGALNKSLVCIAAAAAKLVVEMGHREPPAAHGRQPCKQMQQNHRIQPARNRHQDDIALAEKPFRANGFPNPLRQIAHVAMLCVPARTGNVLCRPGPAPGSQPKLLISPVPALTLPRMANTSLSELIPVLQVAIGPVILISGVGLLLLTLTNRLGRAIDRSRQLAQEMGKAPADEREWLAKQIDIIYRRAGLIRVAVVMSAVCVLLVAVLIPVLFITALLKLEDALLIIAIFIVCMVSLIISLVAFIWEIQLSLRALKLELERVRGGPASS
jgi:hypothetical protein